MSSTVTEIREISAIEAKQPAVESGTVISIVRDVSFVTTTTAIDPGTAEGREAGESSSADAIRRPLALIAKPDTTPKPSSQQPSPLASSVTRPTPPAPNGGWETKWEFTGKPARKSRQSPPAVTTANNNAPPPSTSEQNASPPTPSAPEISVFHPPNLTKATDPYACWCERCIKPASSSRQHSRPDSNPNTNTKSLTPRYQQYLMPVDHANPYIVAENAAKNEDSRIGRGRAERRWEFTCETLKRWRRGRVEWEESVLDAPFGVEVEGLWRGGRLEGT